MILQNYCGAMSEILKHLNTLWQKSEGVSEKKWHKYCLDNAKVVEIKSVYDVLTNEEIERLKEYFPPMQGRCYENAHKATTICNVEYVEGYTVVGGYPLKHAFNKRGNDHFDVTLEMVLGFLGTEYVSLCEIDGLECTRIALRTGHYGNYCTYLYNEMITNKAEQRRKQQRAYYKQNREKKLKYQRKYYEDNREQEIERHRKIRKRY